MVILLIPMGQKNVIGKSVNKDPTAKMSNVYLLRKNGSFAKTRLNDIPPASIKNTINYTDVNNGVIGTTVDCTCELRKYQKEEPIVVFNGLEDETYLEPALDGTISVANRTIIKSKITEFLTYASSIESINRNNIIVFYWYLHGFVHENSMMAKVATFLKSFIDDYANEFGNFIIIERNNKPIIIRNLAEVA